MGEITLLVNCVLLKVTSSPSIVWETLWKVIAAPVTTGDNWEKVTATPDDAEYADVYAAPM